MSTDGDGHEGVDAAESTLQSAAIDVYRNETGELVGPFEDRATGQETFWRIHRLDDDRSIRLTRRND